MQLNAYTLEMVPPKGISIKRKFSTLGSALVAFHVQSNTEQHKEIALWDNRRGEVIRHWAAR